MNLLLLEKQPASITLGCEDPRREHILKVLRCRVGDVLDVGSINGPRGKATVAADHPTEGITLSIQWGGWPRPLFPLTVVTPFARPQTGRRLLQAGASLGAARLLFFQGDKSEGAYRKSRLWQGGAWRDYLMQGAEQAFSTWLPAVDQVDGGLAAALGTLEDPAARLALDVYEAPSPLSRAAIPGGGDAVVLALGGERGWSPRERTCLREGGFALHHLGSRIQRTEVALAVAFGVVAPRAGWLDDAADAVQGG